MAAFCKKLKQLRGKLPVEDLAKQRGVAASSIYKAEATSKVMWRTVEKIYGGLFKDMQDQCETLVMWAVEQAEPPLSLPLAQASAQRLLTRKSRELMETTQTICQTLQHLPPEEREILLRFIEQYHKSTAVKQMVAAFLRALEGK